MGQAGWVKEQLKLEVPTTRRRVFCCSHYKKEKSCQGLDIKAELDVSQTGQGADPGS